MWWTWHWNLYILFQRVRDLLNSCIVMMMLQHSVREQEAYKNQTNIGRTYPTAKEVELVRQNHTILVIVRCRCFLSIHIFFCRITDIYFCQYLDFLPFRTGVCKVYHQFFQSTFQAVQRWGWTCWTCCWFDMQPVNLQI